MIDAATTNAATPDRVKQPSGGAWRFYAIWLAAAVALVALPLIFSSGGSLTSFSLIGIAIIFALSYNILLGQTGLLSFGHAVHYGLGGFLAVHMMNAVANHDWPIPLPLIPLFGGIGGLAFALLVGWVMTKRAGTVFAMISLGIGELVASSSLILRSVFGGESGITTDRTALPHMFGWSFGPQLQVTYLIAFWVMVSAVAMYALTRTPLGRVCNAVRDNPERVQFIGYDPHVVRYIAYAFAGFFAGIAGALAAINFEIANSAYLGATQSGLVLFAAFIGGTAYFFGPVLGAILVTYLQLGLTNVTSVWQLYFGIIFIGIVMFAPGGIAGILMMHRPLLRARTLGTVIPSYLVAAIPTLALALGIILVIETLARNSTGSGDVINLFGLSFNPAAPATWAVAAVLLVGGYLASRLTWRRITDAWDNAATAARDRGYLA
jgi:branched-chain amino acid transport system permease protein